MFAYLLPSLPDEKLPERPEEYELLERVLLLELRLLSERVRCTLSAFTPRPDELLRLLLLALAGVRSLLLPRLNWLLRVVGALTVLLVL